MNLNVQNILKKINYIESDIEIHKQILFSIPSDKPKEMEETLQRIADKKEEITHLRAEIQKIDPEEYERLQIFDKAIADFRKLAAEKNYTTISSMSTVDNCSISLGSTGDIPCLIKACDAAGDWTIITMDGTIEHYTKEQVTTSPDDSVSHTP